MLKLDGKTLSYDVAFTHNEINYPANWLRLASLEEKNSIGITEVADPPFYDQRFYWGTGNPKALEDTNNYASYDKDGKGVGEVTSVTSGLKTNWIAQQKAIAGSLLAQTDWMVVRYAEATTAIPDSTKTYRAAVRTACGEREAQITACADTDALCALVTNALPAKVDGTTEIKKEVLVDGESQDPKVYESYDPKQYEQIDNPALLKDWPS